VAADLGALGGETLAEDAAAVHERGGDREQLRVAVEPLLLASMIAGSSMNPSRRLSHSDGATFGSSRSKLWR